MNKNLSKEIIVEIEIIRFQDKIKYNLILKTKEQALQTNIRNKKKVRTKTKLITNIIIQNIKNKMINIKDIKKEIKNKMIEEQMSLNRKINNKENMKKLKFK